MLKPTPQQRVVRAVARLIGHENYMPLGGLLMIGTREVLSVDEMRKRVPSLAKLEQTLEAAGHPDPTVVYTAATDGRDEVYCDRFVDQLSDPKLRFVILHEVHHKMLEHTTTWQGLYREDERLANVACDFVVNGMILKHAPKDGFIEMPEGGCFDPKYDGWNAKQVYDDLKKQMQQQQPSPNGGKGDGSQGEGSQEGEPGDGQERHGDGPTDGPQDSLDHHMWDEAKKMDAKEREQLKREIDTALRQASLIAGKTGTGGERDLEELLKVQVDWKEATREFLTKTCAGSEFSTWRRPNRRYISSGIYMPSGQKICAGELVIATDTSGSIGPQELQRCYSELAGICEIVKPEAVRVLYWDTDVCQAEYYSDVKPGATPVADLVKSTKPAGGGGTDVRCVIEYIKANNIHADGVIVFTDGYLGGGWGNWGDLGPKLLWCFIDNESARAPVGINLYVSTREL